MLYACFPGSPKSVRKALDELTENERVQVLANLWKEEPIPNVDLFEQFP